MTYNAKELIPHRDEMLFVDKIISLEGGVRATGEWRPADNPWLAANPGSAMVPTLPLEALAQLGACTVFALDRYRGRTPLLAGFKDVQFPNQFCIDAVVDLSVEIIMLGSRFGKAHGSATIETRTVCQGEIQFVMM
ncbi:MAG: 3-hydroxyacyl-[acyl-carrier-protein] dehydratase FabZ [Myxococcota bacterium]